MSQSEWDRRCEGLAEEIRAACAEAFKPADARVEDRTTDMWAEEDDPLVVPACRIGLIYRFRVRVRVTRHLFGLRWLPIRSWRTVVRFGMEEMWAAPTWATRLGLWCVVHDAAATGPVRSIMERFSNEHRIGLDFSGT